MKKLIFLLFLVSLFLNFTNKAWANVVLKQIEPAVIRDTTKSIKFIFTSDNRDFIPGQKYTLNLQLQNAGFGPISNFNTFITGQDKDKLEISIDVPFNGLKAGQWVYKLCFAGDFVFAECSKTTFASGAFNVLLSLVYGLAMDQSSFQQNTRQKVYILNAQPGISYKLWFDGELFSDLFTGSFNSSQIVKSQYHDKTAIASVNVGEAKEGSKALCMTTSTVFVFTDAGLTCDYRLTGINVSLLAPKDPGGPIQLAIPDQSAPPPAQSSDLIFSVKPTNQPPAGPCEKGFCETAFLNIDTNPAGFIKSIFTILLSLAGGVALLLIIFSGYRLMASQGNPEKVQEAREQLTSAVVGLLFIIFSLSILTIIGVDILKIPGFGT